MEPLRIKEVIISLLGAGAITIGALTLTGGLTPNADNTLDIGTAILRYANSYVVTQNATTTNALTGNITNVAATAVTSTSYGSAATTTFNVNNRATLILTGSSATSTLDVATVDSCFRMKGNGATTNVRIDATGSLVTSTTACPTSP